MENSSEMGQLVHDLTENVNLELRTDTMSKIKSACKSSSENISHFFHLLMIQLRREHSEVRYIVLLAIDELFQRSYEFRRMMEGNLEEFLELTLETDKKKLLPPPKSVADRLKSKAQLVIKEWDTKFGSKHKKINHAFAFLKSCGVIDSDSSGNHTQSTQHQRTASEIRRLEKLSRTKQEMEFMEPEIFDCINKLENYFQLVLPLPTDLFPSSCFETEVNSFPDVENDSKKNEDTTKDDMTLRTHGIYNIQNSLSISLNDVNLLTVKETTDNSVVIQDMNEMYSKIMELYLPAVTKWLKVFSKDEQSGSLIKKSLEIKQKLQAKIDKYKKLNFESNLNVMKVEDSDEESDSDFEEVKEKEGFEAFAVSDDPVINARLCVRTCHALLPSGKLCPRQDKFKCPFHGPIVDRDEHGFVINQTDELNQPSTSQSSLPDWQDPELLRDIQSNIGIDLTLPEKRRSKTGRLTSKRRKKSVRTDVKNISNTTYNRLCKKVFKGKKLKK